MEADGGLARKAPGERAEPPERDLRLPLVETPYGRSDPRLHILWAETSCLLEDSRRRSRHSDSLESYAVQEELAHSAAIGAASECGKLIPRRQLRDLDGSRERRDKGRQPTRELGEEEVAGEDGVRRVGLLLEQRSATRPADRPGVPRAAPARGEAARRRSSGRACRAARGGRGSRPARTQRRRRPWPRASRDAQRELPPRGSSRARRGCGPGQDRAPPGRRGSRAQTRAVAFPGAARPRPRASAPRRLVRRRLRRRRSRRQRGRRRRRARRHDCGRSRRRR